MAAPSATVPSSSIGAAPGATATPVATIPYVLADGEETFNFLNDQKQRITGILARAPSSSSPSSSSSSSSRLPVVILAHGLACHKNWRLLPQLSADIIRSTGASVLRFDFSGCGDSEGEFQYGGYIQYVADLRAAVLCLRHGTARVYDNNNNDSKNASEMKFSGYDVVSLIGHSMGGNLVLLYTSRYDDIPLCINMSGRYHMQVGIRVGVTDAARASLSANGYYDEYMEGRWRRITVATLAERRATTMTVVDRVKQTRIMTLHGSADRVIPVTDSKDGLAVLLANTTHEFHVIDGCDHNYTSAEHYNAAWLQIARFLTTHFAVAIKAASVTSSLSSSAATTTATPSSSL